MNSPNPAAAMLPPDEKLQRFYWHEFGHYVVARALGFTTNGVEIKTNPLNPPNLLGASKIVPYRSGVPSAEWYLERRIAVIFGGVCAQNLKQDFFKRHFVNPFQAADSLLQEQSDFDKSGELLYALRNILYPSTPCGIVAIPEMELLEIQGDLLERTIKVVVENAETVKALAERTHYPRNGCVLTEQTLSGYPEVQKIRYVHNF